jgi:hypothetical protein
MEIPGYPPQSGAMMTSTSLLLILWMASASCSAQTLVIGLYDYSDLSAKETTHLTEAADQAFGHSGIHVLWRHCRGVLAVMPETTCQGEIQDNEIVVRLQPGGPRSSNGDRMGSAIVNAEGGTYAIVFVSAVRAQAAGFGVAFDILLGHVVAHEAGHCLLGPGHSYAGLMRGAWNRKDAGEMSRLSLHLTKQEARKAVAALGAAVGNRHQSRPHLFQPRPLNATRIRCLFRRRRPRGSDIPTVQA